MMHPDGLGGYTNSLYSPSRREEVFSETELPVNGVLDNSEAQREPGLLGALALGYRLLEPATAYAATLQVVAVVFAGLVGVATASRRSGGALILLLQGAEARQLLSSSIRAVPEDLFSILALKIHVVRLWCTPAMKQVGRRVIEGVRTRLQSSLIAVDIGPPKCKSWLLKQSSLLPSSSSSPGRTASRPLRYLLLSSVGLESISPPCQPVLKV